MAAFKMYEQIQQEEDLTDEEKDIKWLQITAKMAKSYNNGNGDYTTLYVISGLLIASLILTVLAGLCQKRNSDIQHSLSGIPMVQMASASPLQEIAAPPTAEPVPRDDCETIMEQQRKKTLFLTETRTVE